MIDMKKIIIEEEAHENCISVFVGFSRTGQKSQSLKKYLNNYPNKIDEYIQKHWRSVEMQEIYIDSEDFGYTFFTLDRPGE